MELDDTNTLTSEVETPTPSEDVETQTQEDEGPVSLDPVDESEVEEVTPDEGEEETTDETIDPEVEFAEVEIDGKVYQVPAELKDGYMKHTDYTQKSQRNADGWREIEVARAEVERSRNASDDDLNNRAQLMGINQRIEEYSNVDWNAWQQSNRDAAQDGWMEYQRLEHAQKQLETQIGEADSKRSELAEQDTANRLRQTLEHAKTNIEGWTPEIDQKVTRFAVETLGFSQDTLKGAYTPQVYQTLYLAMLGQASLTQQSAVKSNTGLRPSKIKPLKTVSAKNSGKVNKDPSEMSMDEYDKWAGSKYKD